MPPIPFVIFFQERSGSSFFVSVLNSHPDIYCRYEDFATIAPQHTSRCLHPMTGGLIEAPTNDQTQEHLLWMYHRPAKASGFKFNFPYQYNRYPEILMILLKRQSRLRVIHLEREDRVKRLVSMQHMQAMREVKQMTSGNIEEARDSIKFSLDVPESLDLYQLDTHRRAELQCIVQQFPNRLTVQYEQLLEAPEKAFNRIANFLDVDAFQTIETRFEKATPSDLRIVVENYSELQLALKSA